MDDLPVEKIQISGPTLASLLHRFSSSAGDFDGLLFGSVTHVTPNLSDDPATTTAADTSSFDSSTLLATITSFVSFSSTNSFYSLSGHLKLPFLQHQNFLPSSSTSPTTVIGWFSGRRRSPLRPSMRESMVTSSLSSAIQLSFSVQNSPQTLTLAPSFFLLLTTPFHDQHIHTLEYRAFQFRLSSESFEPKTLDIVNIGPAFRGHYGAFSPFSPFPAMPFELRGLNSMAEDGKTSENSETLKSTRKASKYKKELHLCAEAFEIGSFGRLMGTEAASYTIELEDLYDKMLAKLDSLARMVEKSSARVLEQENQNMKLRHKVAGLE